MDTSIGILGLAMYLPSGIRRNDWWPSEVVARWQAQREAAPRPPVTSPWPAAPSVMKAMSEQALDPFLGTVERRVMPEDMMITEMEAHAARAAIERAAIAPSSIDLVLTYTAVPRYLLTNAACSLHHELGLSPSAFTLQTDGSQHAFFLQLTIAESMIKAGHANCALLVQSSALSRILDYSDPSSVMFGDGATAAIVGRVANGYGLLATTHRTDGRHPNTLIASVPGGAWYDEGRAFLHVADPAGMQDILLRTVDLSKEGIESALARAGHRPDDVDVFAMHQGMPWLRKLVQEHTGLHAARAVDTFEKTAHLFGAFVPSTLVAAEADGVLGAGDLVVLAGGGNGMTYGAIVMRWGTS